MYKSSYQNKILNTLTTTLPDDRPITSIQIVEYIEKCPKGFIAISKTYDQDQDADLWREPSFLKRKSGRYLCLSKSEGLPNFVVQEVAIFYEKSLPPQGYSLLLRTVDTEQKAWRKKQLCYRLAKRNTAQQAVTDIIICSRLKKAPNGFNLAGEINGMTICYKMGNAQDTANSGESNGHNSQNNVGLPSPRSLPDRPAPPVPPQNHAYPQLDGGDSDYETLNPNFTPVRPAPRPPVNNYNTLVVHNGLEGIPFILNPKFVGGSKEMSQTPVIKAKTMQQLMLEYDYNFTVERQVETEKD